MTMTDGGLNSMIDTPVGQNIAHRMMGHQSKEVVTGNDDEEDWQATMTEDGSQIDVMNPPVEHGMAPRMTGGDQSEGVVLVTGEYRTGDDAEDWQVTSTDDGGLSSMMDAPVGQNIAPRMVCDQSKEMVTGETGEGDSGEDWQLTTAEDGGMGGQGDPPMEQYIAPMVMGHQSNQEGRRLVDVPG